MKITARTLEQGPPCWGQCCPHRSQLHLECLPFAGQHDSRGWAPARQASHLWWLVGVHGNLYVDHAEVAYRARREGVSGDACNLKGCVGHQLGALDITGNELVLQQSAQGIALHLLQPAGQKAELLESGAS